MMAFLVRPLVQRWWSKSRRRFVCVYVVKVQEPEGHDVAVWQGKDAGLAFDLLDDFQRKGCAAHVARRWVRA